MSRETHSSDEAFVSQRWIDHRERREILARASTRLLSIAGFAGNDARAQGRAHYHIQVLRKHGALEAISLRRGTSRARLYYRATRRALPIGFALAESLDQGEDLS